MANAPRNDRAEDSPKVLMSSRSQENDAHHKRSVVGKNHDAAKKVWVLVLTTIIFCCFVGLIFGASYFSGALENDFQFDVMVYVVIPLLFTSILCILPAMAMQGEITTDFLQNMSNKEDSVKIAVQSSATNTSLVCALIATIAIPLMHVDQPENEDVDRIFWFYWFYGLASIASSCSLTGTVMGVLVLMYTDPLSNSSTLVFVNQFKGAIGLPVALLLGSFTLLMAALATYSMYVLDILYFICHAIEILGAMFCIVLFQRFCSNYKNEVDALIDHETSLLGSGDANDKITSKFLRGLDSVQLVALMRKNSSVVFPLSVADAFEAEGISGAMLSALTYDIVTAILERNKINDAKVKIGDVINVCSKLGISTDK